MALSLVCTNLLILKILLTDNQSQKHFTLDNVKLFLENCGFYQEAGMISSVGDAIS